MSRNANTTKSMNTKRALFSWITLTCLLLYVPTGRAEYLFESSNGTQERIWKEAESSLLSGLGHTYDGLAALDSKYDKQAQVSITAAYNDFKEAESLYRELESTLTSPVKVSSNEAARKTALELFHEYEIKFDINNEHDAAQVARSETIELMKVFENTSFLSKPDLKATPKILKATIRIQRVGISVSDLFKDHPDPTR